MHLYMRISDKGDFDDQVATVQCAQIKSQKHKKPTSVYYWRFNNWTKIDNYD